MCLPNPIRPLIALGGLLGALGLWATIAETAHVNTLRADEALPLIVPQQSSIPYQSEPVAATPPPAYREVAADAVAPSPEPEPPVENPSLTQGVLRHCSIVGAVRYPGTYATAPKSMLLSRLIEEAGGLTDDAVGTVRILHEGHQQQISCTGNLPPITVPPDSVVVIDAAHHGPHAAESDVLQFIDVACLHLLDRPMVLWLKPEHATLPRLMSLLGQSPSIAQHVQVIQPPVAAHDPEDRLASGTVLAFDPGTVDRAALEAVFRRWPLQDLIVIDDAASEKQPAESADGAGPLASLSPRGRETPAGPTSLPQPASRGGDGPAFSRTPSPDRLLTANSRDGQSGTTASSAPEALRQPDIAAPNTEAQSPAVQGREMPDNLSPESAKTTRDRAVEPASALQLQRITGPKAFPPPSPNEQPLKPVAAAESGRLAPAQPALQSESIAVRPDTGWMRLFRQTGMALAALLCGLTVFGALRIAAQLRSGRKRRTELLDSLNSERERQPEDAGPRRVLEPLINNVLPITEEDAASSETTFHGRMIGFRYLIRSGPHPIQGPHFDYARRRRDLREPAFERTGPEATFWNSSDSAQRYTRVDEAQTPPPASAQVSGREHRPADAGQSISPLEKALRSIMRQQRNSVT